MPASVVKLSVLDKSIKGEAKMPLIELEGAIKQTITNVNSLFFSQYFAQHIRAFSCGKEWRTTIISTRITSARDSVVGNYKQVIVTFEMFPVANSELRKFTFNYDVIMHEVITDKALVLLDQDWDNGIHDESGARVVGIIKLNVREMKIHPLEVNLEKGSSWKGFCSMVKLGMEHIKEGTDHLLFLIVLLLPSMLLAGKKKWEEFGGVKYSLTRLLKIVTAFTIGHSVTLLLGSLGWLSLPGQPVEVLIACSILVSAIHAIYPLFPGRETFIAAGFGLIHGMAFASVLANLNLSVRTLTLSILGFNIGIEMMQLFVIAITVPWLILLSRTSLYKWFRIPAAVLAGIAALGWITQRISGDANFITDLLDEFTPYAGCLVLGLALTSIAVSVTMKYLAKLEKMIDGLAN